MLTSTAKPKIVDLFAGVGGFSLGAARAGFNVELAVELDPHAISAHKCNFHAAKHLSADISSINGTDILEAAGLKVDELDGLVGGPPCQGFSTIGKGRVSDSRNDLFIKYFKLICEIRPRFFIAENVLGILNEKYDEIREKALGYISSEYTILPPMKFDASEFGAPTTRKRVFFIGFKNEATNSLSTEMFFSRKVETKVNVGQGLMGLPQNIKDDWIQDSQSWREVEELPTSYFWDRVSGQIPENVGDPESLRVYKENKKVSGCFGTRHSAEVQERFDRLGPGERDNISKSVRLDINGLCPTIRAGTNKDHGSFQAVRPIHPIKPRVISPREAARLQGFPDWFRFAPSKWHSFRQIGNSVSPILAEIVFDVIRERS